MGQSVSTRNTGLYDAIYAKINDRGIEGGGWLLVPIHIGRRPLRRPAYLFPFPALSTGPFRDFLLVGRAQFYESRVPR